MWTFNIGAWTLNAVDIVILVIVLSRAVVGAARGFFDDFSHTSGLFGGAFFALLFTSTIAPLITNSFNNVPVLIVTYITFVVLALVGYLAFRLIGKTLSSAFETLHLVALNVILGFAWGMLLSAFSLSVLLYVLSLQHIIDFSRFFDSSLFVSRVIQPLLPYSLEALKGVINV